MTAPRPSRGPQGAQAPPTASGVGSASDGDAEADMAPRRLTGDERLDLIDRLPADMNIWADDDELEWFTGRDWRWWADALGHPKAHPSCCKTCGCATTCLHAAFHDALVATVIRELDKLGALRVPKEESRG